MLLEKLLGAVFQFREFKNRRDGDTVDRINHQYSSALFVLLTIVISVKQYVGAPIDCWCPAQFTDSHVTYTNAICWLNSTYYSAFDEPMPGSFPGFESERLKRRRTLSYYQWVPFVLMAQAGMFITPRLLWRFAGRRVGVDVAAIVETAQSYQRAMYVEARDQALRFVVNQVDGYLRQQKHRRTVAVGNDCCWRLKDALATHCCLYWARFYGNHLLCVYVGIKLLYLANAIGQILFLDRFLAMRTEYYVYGVTVVGGLLAATSGDSGTNYYDDHYGGLHLAQLDWPLSDRFPRVTLCDFQIRQQTNVHRYTVQCVLPINLFNEKVFLLIWFWLVFVALATLLDIVYWTYKLAILSTQMPYVRRQLRAAAVDLDCADDSDEADQINHKQCVSRFVLGYLRRDGLLLVRLIASNVSHLAASQLVYALWNLQGAARRRVSQDSDVRPPKSTWKRRVGRKAGTSTSGRLKPLGGDRSSGEDRERVSSGWLLLRRVFGQKKEEVTSTSNDVTINGGSFTVDCDV